MDKNVYIDQAIMNKRKKNFKVVLRIDLKFLTFFK